MTISDDMVELGAKGLFLREHANRIEYEYTPSVTKDIYRSLARAALTAALEGSVAVPAWQDISTAPSACHVIACRFDECEWIYAIVSSPPTKPFTHWQMLPEPPAITRQDRLPTTDEVKS